MIKRRSRWIAGSALVVVAVLAAACSSSKSSTTATSAASTSSTASVTAISVTSFGADFSAMAQLKSLASQGKGLIGVLLPDTTTSTRYVSYDAPVPDQGVPDRRADVAASSRSTTPRAVPPRCRPRPTPTSPTGASVLIVDPARLRQRRGHRGRRRVQGRQGHRLRPPDARAARPAASTSASTTSRSAS